MTRWQVTSYWRGGTLSDARVTNYMIGGENVAKDFTIPIDEPLALRGLWFDNGWVHIRLDEWRGGVGSRATRLGAEQKGRDDCDRGHGGGAEGSKPAGRGRADWRRRLDDRR